jgi:hypothetical protein
MGTTNAEMPRCPLLGSVFANTTVHVACPAFVMNVFEPFRTYALRRRLHTRDVGTSVRLAEPERAEDRLLEKRRQPRLLLLIRAGEEHGTRPEAVGEDRRADARAPPVELFADKHAVERRQPEAAERLGDVEVHETELMRLRDHVGWVGRALVVLGRLRADLLLRELARERAQLTLLGRQCERDAASDACLQLGHGLGSGSIDQSVNSVRPFRKAGQALDGVP